MIASHSQGLQNDVEYCITFIDDKYLVRTLSRKGWKIMAFCFPFSMFNLVSHANLVTFLLHFGRLYIPVVPGQAGGGSFQKEKNYIAQKEFAYRMCAW